VGRNEFLSTPDTTTNAELIGQLVFDADGLLNAGDAAHHDGEYVRLKDGFRRDLIMSLRQAAEALRTLEKDKNTLSKSVFGVEQVG